MNNETAPQIHLNGNGKTQAPVLNGNRNSEGQGGVAEGGNVDRIRDILFGSQMRDYDGRFQRLEERLVHDASVLRDDVHKRLEALEGFMKSAVDSLTTRVKSEQSERALAIEKLGRDLAEVAKSVEAKMGRLDERASTDAGSLRQQLLDQSKAIGAEIKAKHEEIRKKLDSEAQLIRGAMTGRESLAEMLSEVALRLKGEFRVVGAS